MSQRALFQAPSAQYGPVTGAPPFRGHALSRREQIQGVTHETPTEIRCDCSDLLGVVYVWHPVPGCEGWWECVERRRTPRSDP